MLKKTQGHTAESFPLHIRLSAPEMNNLRSADLHRILTIFTRQIGTQIAFTVSDHACVVRNSSRQLSAICPPFLTSCVPFSLYRL